jgi:predicted MFS family arabinose efflux permease
MSRPTTSPYPWYVLGLLFAVYVMNMADRQLVGILAENIRRDLRLSDSQIGIIAGPAIAFFYAVLGVPMAYAADRVNRVRFVAASLAVWSVMTILGGRATSLVQLALTRVGVSVAEAGGSPSSVSLLADLFRPHRRAGVMAIWTAGSTAGIFVGFALGGVINQAIGWRDTFLVAGVPGLLLAAALLLTVREPVRGAADDAWVTARPKVSRSMAQSFAFLWKIRIYRQVVLASAACNFCVFGVLTWAPPFAVRSFGVGTGVAGTVIGTGILLAGGTTMVIAGFVSDRLARKGLHRPLLAVAGCVALSGALFVLAFTATRFETFALLFTCAYAMLMANPPIIWVIIQGSSPPEMRAMAVAINLLVVNICSSVPAPLLIGVLSDRLRPHFGNHSLAIALLLVPLAAAIAALQFVRVAASSRRKGLEHG